MSDRRDLKGDLFGGFTAAVIALPLAIAFGVAAFAPLGPERAAEGALAGVCGAIVGGCLAAVFGGTPTQITGPTGPMTVLLAALLTSLLADPRLPADGAARVETALALLFLCVSMAGVGQVLLGVLRLGTLVKFIPYPVIAGFMNGIAVIIFWGQLPPLLADGLPTAAVGFITVAVVAVAPRITAKVPGSLLGLLLGSAAFYALQAAGFKLGAVVGDIPAGIPLPQWLPRMTGLFGQSPGLVWSLVPSAAALAVLGAIDSLLTSVVADTVTRTRHDSNAELRGQGVGNLVAGFFGGLAGSGATVRTLVNIDAGGRTRWSGVTQSAVLLAVLLVLGRLAGRIPKVVLAGILIVTAVKMVDEWSRSLVARLAASQGEDAPSTRQLWSNLAVVGLVTVVTVAVDLITAVAVGLVVACGIFVARMSGAAVGPAHQGALRSRRVRSEDDERRLDGLEFAVFELHGALFFGSADAVARAVDDARDARCVVLDLRGVQHVDSSGARVLGLLAQSLRAEGRTLLLSYVKADGRRMKFLQNMGALDLIGADHVFPDTDSALESMENLVAPPSPAGDAPLPLAGFAVVDGLTDAERAVLERHLRRLEVPQGDAICRQGDPGDSFLLLARGIARASVEGPHGQRLRLATYPAGVVLGEGGVLRGRPRQADIDAETDCTLYVLRVHDLERLRDEQPALVAKLMWNIATILSARLVQATRHAVALDGARR